MGSKVPAYSFSFPRIILMLLPIIRRAALALLGTVALVSTGCISSSQGVTVSGKVILPPAAKLIDTDAAQITFFPQAGATGGKTAAAKIATDGTFTCKDVLPGRYKLIVNLMPYPGIAGQAKHKAQLEKVGKVYDEQHSKLTDEVTAVPQQITVDLLHGTVTKS